MTGIIVAFVLVFALLRLPKLLGTRRAITPRFEPIPLADRRSAPPGWFAAEQDAEPEEPEPAAVAPAIATQPVAPTRYLLDAGPAAAGDRTRAMMDMFAAPGICTPRGRRR